MAYGTFAGEARGDAEPLERLILELGRLPGIGERSAARLAFYLLKQARETGLERSLAFDLSRVLMDVVQEVGLCARCFNLSTTDTCALCKDARRDSSVLCVVETVADLRALEATGVYRGMYHVLHGALAPLDGVGPEDLKLHLLEERVEAEGFREVIVGTNADVEGDATAFYLSRLLQPKGVKISRLASGIPMGGELE
ncbi:MAG: recombination mediator RecR, partial [Myxococcota bacterium]|nr:recombination mediator RecR [Myxococcota bacterium]